MLAISVGNVFQSPLPTHGWISVLGKISFVQLGKVLIHEHIMVDFIGAKDTGPERYQVEEVIEKVLPYLLELKNSGCRTFVDCTPAYLGRDPKVLKALSVRSGLNIFTNTGYYGAVNGKYLPDHAFTESSNELSLRWIKEARSGIGETGILPGFIKIGVNNGPLNEIDRKLVEAAVLTHQQTGLTISSHTGNGEAALEQLQIILRLEADPGMFRWVHAQNEKDSNIHLEIADRGAYVEFDGINQNTAEEHLQFILNIKENGLLSRCLISQDSGWYHVGEEDGGMIKPYSYLFKKFIPLMQMHGFSKKDLHRLLVRNPAESLKIRKRIK